MVSIPRPTLGQLGGCSPMGSPPHDPSPTSPKSWEDSLLELDSDLQRICGSPSPASSTLSLYKCNASPSQTSPPIQVSPPAFLSRDAELSLSARSCRRTRSHDSPHGRPRTLSQGAQPAMRGISGSPNPTYFLRSQSQYGHGHPNTARPLTVRHEETPKKLAEKLSRICGPGTLHESLNLKILTPTQPKDVMPLHSNVFRRESLKTGFKHKVSVGGAEITDLSVVITDTGTLCVQYITSPETRVLDEVTLPSSIALRHLMCYMLEDELCIRERSKPLWYESQHIGPQYIPILQEGDFANDLRVVIRVPDVIRYQDLSVRTVDDSLIISRKRSSVTGVTVPPYEVSLVLPDKGNSRGVQASLSHHNQLYIVVSFDMC